MICSPRARRSLRRGWRPACGTRQAGPEIGGTTPLRRDCGPSSGTRRGASLATSPPAASAATFLVAAGRGRSGRDETCRRSGRNLVSRDPLILVGVPGLDRCQCPGKLRARQPAVVIGIELVDGIGGRRGNAEADAVISQRVRSSMKSRNSSSNTMPLWSRSIAANSVVPKP